MIRETIAVSIDDRPVDEMGPIFRFTSDKIVESIAGIPETGSEKARQMGEDLLGHFRKMGHSEEQFRVRFPFTTGLLEVRLSNIGEKDG